MRLEGRTTGTSSKQGGWEQWFFKDANVSSPAVGDPWGSENTLPF